MSDDDKNKIIEILKNAPIDKSLGFPDMTQLEIWNYFNDELSKTFDIGN